MPSSTRGKGYKDMKTREHLCAVCGNVNGGSLYEKQIVGYSKKLKTQHPYDPAIPMVGIHLKEMKTGYRKLEEFPC